MRMGVEYRFTVSMRKFTVEMRPLSNAESMQAYGAVAEHMRGIPEFRRTKITEDNLLAREFLKIASGPYGNFAPKLSDPILDAMSNDELMFLYKQWVACCEKVNPVLEKMDLDKIKELVEIVKKNPPADLDFQLTELSFGQLVSLASYLLTKEG